MELQLNEKYVYDQKGQKKEVIIGYKEYLKLMALLEDLDDIEEIKKVEAEETMPWEEVKNILSSQDKL